MKFWWIILFLPMMVFGVERTNRVIVTNDMRIITTNLTVERKGVPRVQTRVRYKYLTLTNYIIQQKDVYITNVINRFETRIEYITQTEYVTNIRYLKQYTLLSLGYSYCGRLVAGWDIMNILQVENAGFGLGIWTSYNTTRFFDRNWDLGLKLNFGW